MMTFIKRRSRGTLTVEAALICFPFISFLVFLLVVFYMLLLQLQLEVILGETAKLTSQYGYLLEDQEGSSAVSTVYANLKFKDMVKKGNIDLTYVKDKLSGLYILSEYQEDTQDFRFTLTYQLQFPLGIKVPGGRVISQLNIHSWSGNTVDREQVREYVYITEEGKVYHKNRNCTYLVLTIQVTECNKMEELRNKENSKYRLCEICGSSEDAEIFKKNFGNSGLVYITDYGERYHLDKGCSGLKRTVKKVLLEKVEGWSECSRCRQ